MKNDAEKLDDLVRSAKSMSAKVPQCVAVKDGANLIEFIVLIDRDVFPGEWSKDGIATVFRDNRYTVKVLSVLGDMVLVSLTEATGRAMNANWYNQLHPWIRSCGPNRKVTLA